VFGQDQVQLVLHLQDLAGLDLDVRGLALHTAQGLVDHDPAVGQGEALALGAGGQQHGAHGGGHADADGGHGRADELHGVVDGQAGAHAAARGVDVEVDVLVRILGRQEQQLGHHQVGDVIVDARTQEDDALLEQARVDVECALAAPGGLDDGRDQTHGPPPFWLMPGVVGVDA
jgi:hypothetical protein